MEPTGTARMSDFKDRRILVVEDDRASLCLLGDVLRGEGCVLAEAGSAAQAHEVYASFRPDLVLLSATMPGGEAFAAARQLRKTYGAECVPVIFTTAGNEADAVGAALDAGGADCLPKPFRAPAVLARLRPHLRLRNLAERLNRTDAAKNRFLGMAAHDLRGPLASVRGIAEFLREGAVGPLSSDQRELVDTIHTASEQMLALVAELLDVATIEAGALKLLLAPCDLSELLAEAVALTNLEAAKKKIRVVFTPPVGGAVLSLDAAKMKQVVGNLLSNAVKYSPPGSTVTVVVRPDRAGGTCAFGVRDQGPGIPAGEHEKLFKDFSRLSVRPTGGEKSTGLGLVICRKIVEAHGGTIGAENLPTRGCEFRVTLPAVP